MKLLLISLCVLLVGLVSTLPHHGHDHGASTTATGGEHNHQHSNHSHVLKVMHLAGNDHNETMSEHKSHMSVCHQEAIPVDCSDTQKGRWIFRHMNDTHHECAQLDAGKCSSTSNSFESEELCEKSCHHDDHKMGSEIV